MRFSADAWTRAPRRGRIAAAFVLGLLGAISLAPANAQARLYFTAFLAEGRTGVERAGLAGTGLETVQLEPAGFEDDIALDVPEGTMYWTDTYASVIEKSDLDGSDVQILLDDFGAEPVGIALDVPDGKMYWTDSHGVRRANLDGSDVELVTGEPAGGFIALDEPAQRMYWADFKLGDIKTAAMTPGAEVTNIAVKQRHPFGIAVDPSAGKVFWLDLDLEKNKKEADQIVSANLDGSEARTLISRPGAGFEGGLAVEPLAGKLYWTEAENRDIATANLDGSDVEVLLSTGEDVPEGIAVTSGEPPPADELAPAIEGHAQVGSPLACNPGSWTGTGPLTFAYEWQTAAGSPIEGATGSVYVPPAEDAGAVLECAVSATDRVETVTAASAGVLVAGLPAAFAPAALEAPLVAGIALARLTSASTSASVPVFTSLACEATLEAVPLRPSARRHPRHEARTRPRPRLGVGGQSPVGRAARGSSRRAARTASRRPRRVVVHRALAPGRASITLRGLVPRASYELLLTAVTADGQAASDRATLSVAGAVAQRRR